MCFIFFSSYFLIFPIYTTFFFPSPPISTDSNDTVTCPPLFNLLKMPPFLNMKNNYKAAVKKKRKERKGKNNAKKRREEGFKALRHEDTKTRRYERKKQTKNKA